MYTTCMLCGFLPFNILVLIYQKEKKKKKGCKGALSGGWVDGVGL